MAIATKKLLADGLKELLEKKTLDKITVKELVESASEKKQQKRKIGRIGFML